MTRHPAPGRPAGLGDWPGAVLAIVGGVLLITCSGSFGDARPPLVAYGILCLIAGTVLIYGEVRG